MLFTQIEIQAIDISYFKNHRHHEGIFILCAFSFKFHYELQQQPRNITNCRFYTQHRFAKIILLFILIYNWLSNFCFMIICVSFSTRKSSNHMEIRTMLIQTNSNYNLLIVFVRILNFKIQQPVSYRKKRGSTSLGNCITKGKEKTKFVLLSKTLFD